jgi:hypothetical protein
MRLRGLSGNKKTPRPGGQEGSARKRSAGAASAGALRAYEEGGTHGDTVPAASAVVKGMRRHDQHADAGKLPAAERVPLAARQRTMAWEEFQRLMDGGRADPQLAVELRELVPGSTDDARIG